MKGERENLIAAGLICFKSYLALINCVQTRLFLHGDMVMFPPEVWDHVESAEYKCIYIAFGWADTWCLLAPTSFSSQAEMGWQNLTADVTFFLIPCNKWNFNSLLQESWGSSAELSDYQHVLLHWNTLSFFQGNQLSFAHHLLSKSSITPFNSLFSCKISFLIGMKWSRKASSASPRLQL